MDVKKLPIRHNRMFVTRSCSNCHFLVKVGPDSTRVHWNHEERMKRQVDSVWSLECAKGVWSVGIAPDLRESVPDLIMQHRPFGECFFTFYQEGMSNSCAEDLERRQAEHREMKWSHRYTQIALTISALALVANVILGACTEG